MIEEFFVMIRLVEIMRRKTNGFVRKINGGQKNVYVLIFWYDCVHMYCDFRVPLF